MVRESFATLLKTSSVAFLLFVLLFGESGLLSSPGFIGSVLREITAVLRDAETQWMVFLCLGIYFVVFLFLRAPKGSAHGVPRPTFWLGCALFVSAVLYAINYSPSTQALTLLGGAVLGQGAGLFKSGSRKAESGKPEGGGQKSVVSGQWSVVGNGFVVFVVVSFIVLLTLASVWHLQMGHTFEYRSQARWSGPWDNPNTFGLLMGAGSVLAAGRIVQSLRSKAQGREDGVQSPKSQVQSRLWQWTVIGMCFVAAGLTASGLVHSYSRGAWIATLFGFGYLVWRGVQSLKGEVQSPKSKVQSASFLLRFSRNWLLNSVILSSVLVLAFWHFRQTEWHPARRVLSAVNPADFSWRNRVAAWEGALQMMAEHPWLGAGWSQPEPLYEHYYLPPKLTESAAIQMNDYLMLGATLGIPALFCFAVYIRLTLFWGARPPRAQFYAPSRKISDVPLCHSPKPVNPPGVGCEAHPTTPGAGVLPMPDYSHCELSTPNSQLSTSPPTLDFRPWTLDWTQAICRAGAIVLLIGFWFDGGLFKLPTAATFWILLELGSVAMGQKALATDEHG